MNVDDLYYWLIEVLNQGGYDMNECIESFRCNKIDGESFISLTPQELQELVPVIGERKKIQKLMDCREKIDPVHDHNHDVSSVWTYY